MNKKTVAIVLAGGSGTRMHMKTPKQYLPICGKPMLYYSLKTCDESNIHEVVLVTASGEEDYCKKEIVDKYGIKKVKHIVSGGDERYDSVYAGLMACKDDGCELVLIHDAARPMVSAEIMDEAMHAADAYDAAVIAVPVKDTIKVADDKEYAKETLQRDKLWNIQTPQAFRYDLCMQAYSMLMEERAKVSGVTDDAMVVDHYMHIKSKLCMGDYRNIKVTTAEDLNVAEVYLKPQ